MHFGSVLSVHPSLSTSTRLASYIRIVTRPSFCAAKFMVLTLSAFVLIDATPACGRRDGRARIRERERVGGRDASLAECTRRPLHPLVCLAAAAFGRDLGSGGYRATSTWGDNANETGAARKYAGVTSSRNYIPPNRIKYWRNESPSWHYFIHPHGP